MTNSDFCHLHVHSEFSLLDGAIKLDALCKYIAELGMTSVALTDHGVMSGVVEFYKAALKHKIKPVIGVEAYVTDDEDNLPKTECTRDNFHLVLLAADNIGYRNLVRMVTHAGLENFYYKPRITKAMLRTHADGVIATSGCLACEFSRILQGNTKEAEPLGQRARYDLAISRAEGYRSLFQRGFYLELQDHDDEDPWQEEYNKYVVQMGKDLDIPLVITADAHYLSRDSKPVHDILMAIQLKQTLEEYRTGGYFQYKNTYIRPQKDMLSSAIKYQAEEAFWNTTKVADKCNVTFEFGNYQTPDFDLETTNDQEEFTSWLKKEIQ